MRRSGLENTQCAMTDSDETMFSSSSVVTRLGVSRGFTFRDVVTQRIQEVDSWTQIPHFLDAFLIRILRFSKVTEAVELLCF